jgi:CheY-like chemotaxis protein
VRDTGAGIAPEFLPHVFERFRQADSRTTRQHGGLGLGLAIARHLVQQHGGRIGAHSDGPGHGTRISIALPIPASAGAASLDAPSGHASSLAGCLEGATVLVVDDDQDSRELCGVLLETAGASVTLCGSAAAALDCLETTAFDLVIADIAMPGVDGYAFIAQVRARRAELPAIAMSAHARIEDRRRALAAGYTAYRTKPVDGPQLIIDVADLLARRLV